MKTTVKNSIKRALLKLLAEKDFTSISVSELTESAGVSRMSFYRNFQTTDDVLDDIANDMFYNFYSFVRPVIELNTERKWREFVFETVCIFQRASSEFGISLKMMEQRPNSNRGLIILRVAEKVTRLESTFVANSTKEMYVIHGKLSLINSIAAKWVSAGMRESPEEITALIMSLITKF